MLIYQHSALGNIMGNNQGEFFGTWTARNSSPWKDTYTPFGGNEKKTGEEDFSYILNIHSMMAANKSQTLVCMRGIVKHANFSSLSSSPNIPRDYVSVGLGGLPIISIFKYYPKWFWDRESVTLLWKPQPWQKLNSHIKSQFQEVEKCRCCK